LYILLISFYISARDLWKKRYFDEKKKTGPLEEQSNRLRHELDIIHKRLLTTLEGPKEKATKLNDIKPSSKVGSPPKPLVSSEFQTARSRTPSLSTLHSQPPFDDTSQNRNRGYPSNDESENSFGDDQFKDNDGTSENKGIFLTQLSPREFDTPVPKREPSPSKATQTMPLNEPFDQSFDGRPGQGSPILENPPIHEIPDQGQTSPRRSWRNSQKLTQRGLNEFSQEYMRHKKGRRQYPVDLIGSDNKQAYFENETFDSDYDSHQSSARSSLGFNNTGRFNSRKNVQFNKNVNYIPQHGH